MLRWAQGPCWPFVLASAGPTTEWEWRGAAAVDVCPPALLGTVLQVVGKRALGLEKGVGVLYVACSVWPPVRTCPGTLCVCDVQGALIFPFHPEGRIFTIQNSYSWHFRPQRAREGCRMGHFVSRKEPMWT